MKLTQKIEIEIEDGKIAEQLEILINQKEFIFNGFVDDLFCMPLKESAQAAQEDPREAPFRGVKWDHLPDGTTFIVENGEVVPVYPFSHQIEYKETQ